MTFYLGAQFFFVTAQNLFSGQQSPKSYFLLIRGYSWHKNKIKRIRRGYYCRNNFQDSTKENNRNKTLGYLPRVLFFNAFQLGAKRDFASSIFKWRSIKINTESLLNKDLYFINNATESYHERGKHGYMHLNNIKFPLFMLKFFKFHLFCLPMLATLCFIDLFFYKIPLHRKWVRLKCVL